MQILDVFQRAYVINLPERIDRRRGAAKELQKIGLQFTPDRLELFAGTRPTEPAGFASIGARGCFLSHLQVLKLARNAGLANVLVIEDDLLISPKFKPAEATLMQQLQQQDWHLAYFGDSTDRPAVLPVQFEPLQESILTATFYGVHASIFDRLINFLETLLQRPSGHPDGGPMHLDGAYNLFRQQNPDIITLKTNGGLVAQRSSRSDIYPNSWYETLPIAQSMLNLVRSGKNLIRVQAANLR